MYFTKYWVKDTKMEKKTVIDEIWNWEVVITRYTSKSLDGLI